MNRWIAIAGSAGMGAGMMYLLDPSAGKRRRRELRNQMRARLRPLGGLPEGVAEDLENRARAEVARRVAERPMADRVVAERVRTAVGHASAHPRAIAIDVRGGVVRLRGPVLSREVVDILSAVKGVRGVRRLHSALEVHKHSDNIPDLEGPMKQVRATPELLQEGRSRAVRLLTVAVGGAVALYGIIRRDLVGGVAAALGMAAGIRGLSNRPLFATRGGSRRRGKLERPAHAEPKPTLAPE
jgi:hypothetical protein